MKFPSDDMRIFCVLMRRNVKILKKTMATTFADTVLATLVEILLIGYLLPIMGMPVSMIAPLFIGMVMFLVISQTFNVGFAIIADLNTSRFIDYYMTLPIKKSWLFASYLLNMMIKVGMLAIPIGMLGLLFLHQFIPCAAINVAGIICLTFFTLLFAASFILSSCFLYSYDWFTINLWPRRLSVLTLTGCLFFTWQSIARFAPLTSKLLLLNPVTYLCEGIRASLFGQTHHLPIMVCIIASIFFCCLNFIALRRGVQRCFDPV